MARYPLFDRWRKKAVVVLCVNAKTQPNTYQHNTAQPLCPLKSLSKFLSLCIILSIALPSSWPSQQRLSLNNTRSFLSSLLFSLSLSHTHTHTHKSRVFVSPNQTIFLFILFCGNNRQQGFDAAVLIMSCFVLPGFFRGVGFSCGEEVDAERFRHWKTSWKGKIRPRLFGKGEECEFSVVRVF